MRITYGKDADAMYIKLTNERFSKTKIINKNTILNLDEKGKVIGIELLFVSKRFPKDSFKNVAVEEISV